MAVDSYIDYGVEGALSEDQAGGLFTPVVLNFLSTTHVEVITTIDGVAVTLTSDKFTVTGTSGAATVTITDGDTIAALNTDDSVRITRTTPITSLQRTFTDGSVLKSSDLNAQNQQLLYRLQEQTDSGVGSLPIDTDDKYNAGGKTIKNLPTPGNDDEAVTKSYVDNAAIYGSAFGGTDPQYWSFTAAAPDIVVNDRVFTMTSPTPASITDNMYLVEIGGVLQDPATYTVYTEQGNHKIKILLGATSLVNGDTFFVRNFGVARNAIEQPFAGLDDATIALQVKKFSSGTTADLQQWQTETGTVLAKVEVDGDATFKDLTVGAIAGTGAISGVTSITGTGNISGANISGVDITGTGNAAITGTLASGAATITGNTGITGTLQTSGTITSTGGGIDVLGDGVIDGKLGVGTGASPTGIGDISATGDINANGNITGTDLKATSNVIINPAESGGILAGTDTLDTNLGRFNINTLGPYMRYETATGTGPTISATSNSILIDQGDVGTCHLDMGANKITNVVMDGSPAANDAVNKSYVDAAVSGGVTGKGINMACHLNGSFTVSGFGAPTAGTSKYYTLTGYGTGGNDVTQSSGAFYINHNFGDLDYIPMVSLMSDSSSVIQWNVANTIGTDSLIIKATARLLSGDIAGGTENTSSTAAYFLSVYLLRL